MIYDLHIHSIYSKDSFLKPTNIIRIAKKKGLSGIAVTDHHSIKGGINTLKLNNDENFHVIVGSEIKTEYGDIIGLFLNEDIKSPFFIEAIDEIKDQDGLTILAHPYRKGRTIPDDLIAKIDYIEVFNARSPHKANLMALNLAKQFKKPISAGSDAHMGFEIGRGRMKVSKTFNSSSHFTQETLTEGNLSNYFYVHGASLLIEKIKKIFRYNE